MDYKVICCLGDSVANGYWDEEKNLGWFGRLQENLAKTHPLKFGFNNLAMSGDTTKDVFHRLCGEAISREPDILVIAVGINDIIRWCSEDGVTDQSPQARYEIWQRLLAIAIKNFSKILVVGLFPNDESAYPCTGYDGATHMWHKNSDAKEYNAQIKEWCKKAKVPFLDIYDDWLNAGHEQFLFDGGHPNSKGHTKLAKQVFNELDSLGYLKN